MGYDKSPFLFFFDYIRKSWSMYKDIDNWSLVEWVNEILSPPNYEDLCVYVHKIGVELRMEFWEKKAGSSMKLTLHFHSRSSPFPNIVYLGRVDIEFKRVNMSSVSMSRNPRDSGLVFENILMIDTLLSYRYPYQLPREMLRIYLFNDYGRK